MAGFKVLSPRGTLVKNRSTDVRWQPLTGADNYTVDGGLMAIFNVPGQTSPGVGMKREWTCFDSAFRERLFICGRSRPIKNGKNE